MTRTVVSRGVTSLFSVGLAIAALGMAACGGGGSSATPEEIAKGMDLYRGTCASCHGQDARGMPRLGKDLYANEFVKGLSEEEFVAFLKEGRPANHPLNERKVDMPPKGGNPALQDEDLRLIAVYVRSIQ